MATRTGELRETLMMCIDDVKNGKMDANKANAIAKLAGQISLSMQVELNVREAEKRIHSINMGNLPVGEENSVIEQAPSAPQLPR